MVFDAQQMLRRLEPAVRRGGPGPAVRPVPGLADAGFSDLLTMVASGRIRSDRAVQVGPAAALDPPLAERQLDRLAAAADEAEAAGARRAIMLIDGRGLVLDVAERRIDGEATPGSGPLTDLDAAVAVPADDLAADTAPAADAAPGSGTDGAPGADAAPAAAPAAPLARIGRPLGPPSASLADIARATPRTGTPLASGLRLADDARPRGPD
jgi:hypothetical protein